METELKFEVDAATADQLIEELALAADGEELILKSVYYDTADALLRSKGLALRVREEGQRRVQTLKQTSPGALRRGEWEREIAGPGPDMKAAAGSPLARALGSKGASTLKPTFEVSVERTRREMELPGGVVEVALDRGAVSAQGYGAPICELELELKSGPPALLFDLAQNLSERSALDLSFLSKADRGYALVDGSQLSPVKARPLKLNPRMSAEEAFRAIAAANLAQITANAQVLRAARRPESTHQLRVGVRRLRTAIGMFGEMLADDRREAIKAELKWITGELDAARNLDVFLFESFRPSAAHRHGQPGMAALGAGLLAAQTNAYDAVEAAARSRRFNRLTLDIAAWIETGGWTRDTAPRQAALRERPARVVVAKALAKLHRRLIKRGRKLETLEPEDRHHLRIQAKKLRYAADFSASLYDGKAGRQRERLTRMLSALQDGLGELNDIAVGAGLIAGLVGAGPQGEDGAGRAQADAACAFAAGQVCADREGGRAAAMAASVKAYRRLAKVEPYW